VTELRTYLHFVLADGGRFNSGCRPQFYFNAVDHDCEVVFPNKATVLAGDWVVAVITLSKLACAGVGVGSTFSLRQDAKDVATGIVTKA